MARSWWAIALRGLVAILFAIAAVVWPGLTFIVLVVLFGAYALVDGVFALIAGSQTDRSDLRWPLVIEGLAGVIAGGIAFIVPGLAGLALLYLIAAWAIITGALEIIAAIRLRTAIENEWAMGLMGAASVAFGVLMVINPLAGAIAVVYIIAAYALIFGILLIILGIHLRGLRQEGAPDLGARPA